MNEDFEEFWNNNEKVLTSVILEQIDQANELRNENSALMQMHGMSEEHQKTFEAVANKMVAFENSIINFEILIFFYGDLARAHLHAHKIEKALSYAIAYYKINNHLKDKEGIISSYRLLADLLIVVGDFPTALYCYEKIVALQDNDYNRHIIEELKVYANESDEDSFELLVTKITLPDSYKYIAQENKEETVIRFLMSRMDISRSTAYNYYNYYHQYYKHQK